MKEEMGNPQQLKSLNHISIVCRSVDESLDFYQNVLGFFPIRRPRSFNFDGACSGMEKKLNDMEIEYVESRVEEDGIQVYQLFFPDPDGLMIEICNCDNLPVAPLAGEGVRMCSSFSCSVQQKQQLYEKIS